MKKILFSIIALLGVLGANADTTWDFTSVSDADYAALGNDAVNWAKDASVDRYGNATNLAAAGCAGIRDIGIDDLVLSR